MPNGYEEEGRRRAGLTDQQLEAKASEQGCEVVRPADDELLLDIDSDADHDVFWELLPMGEQLGLWTIKDRELWKSRSGNRHVRLQLAGIHLTDERRIMLQAILGSDRKRELLSFSDFLKGQESPSVLFRVPDPRRAAPPAPTPSAADPAAYLASQTVERSIFDTVAWLDRRQSNRGGRRRSIDEQPTCNCDACRALREGQRVETRHSSGRTAEMTVRIPSLEPGQEEIVRIPRNWAEFPVDWQELDRESARERDSRIMASRQIMASIRPADVVPALRVQAAPEPGTAPRATATSVLASRGEARDPGSTD